MKISRRQMVIFGGGLATVAGGGVAGRFLLRKRYAPSPYDDLIALVPDRDGAAQIGETVLAEADDFDPTEIAAQLRRRIAGRPFAIVAVEDANEGRIVEGGGWVLPETLGLICALAAKADA